MRMTEVCESECVSQRNGILLRALWLRWSLTWTLISGVIHGVWHASVCMPVTRDEHRGVGVSDPTRPRSLWAQIHPAQLGSAQLRSACLSDRFTPGYGRAGTGCRPAGARRLPPWFLLFLHWLYMSAWTLHYDPRPWDSSAAAAAQPVQVSLHLRTWVLTKKQRPRVSNEIQIFMHSIYTQLSAFICSRTFLIWAPWWYHTRANRKRRGSTHRSWLARDFL